LLKCEVERIHIGYIWTDILEISETILMSMK